mgnify:CR=1 FL=1
MEGKEAIIEKIIKNAENLAESAVKEAENLAAEKLQKVNDTLNEAQKNLDKEIEVLKNDTIRHKETVAELEVRKLILTAKREVMDNVYLKAVKKIVNSKDYLALIEKMILKYAEDGDSVIISNRDKNSITPEFVNKIALKKGIKLVLSNDYQNFEGGIILSNKKYDKNLTLNVLFKEIKEDTESRLAEILFD